MPTKYKLEAQAKEEFVIVKRAMNGKIRMELLSSQTKCNTIMIRCCHYGKRIRTKQAPSTNSRTRFESDEGMVLRQTQGPVLIVRSVSLSNWPLLVAYGPDLRVTKVWPFSELRGLVFIVRSVSLSNWPLLVAQGPVANQEFAVHGEKSYFHPLPSFSAKAGNLEIQAVKKKQTHPAQCSLLPTYLSELDTSATVVLIPSSVISLS